MPLGTAGQLWIRARRRLTDVKGILERRRFRSLRYRFYDRLWREAAVAVGAEATRLPSGLVQIQRGSLATFVDQSELMLDSVIASRLLLDKATTYELLAAKGLPTPRTLAFDMDSFHLAEEFLLAQAGPVVVKPADGTGCGHGVTTEITNRATLRDGAMHAAAFHPRLLVEEQLLGSSYRLLFLDGAFIDAVRRDPPTVSGDGRSSIRQLAQQENDRRRAGEPITALSPLVIDRESCNTLQKAGLSPDTAPSQGERVRVKLAANENSASENHVVREDVHPQIVETCGKIAQDFGIGFAGFDLISSDIGAPVESGSTIFTEINAGPGIHHHYLVAEPDKAVPVAPIVLKHIFDRRRGVLDL